MFSLKDPLLRSRVDNNRICLDFDCFAPRPAHQTISTVTLVVASAVPSSAQRNFLHLPWKLNDVPTVLCTPPVTSTHLELASGTSLVSGEICSFTPVAVPKLPWQKLVCTAPLSGLV